jgi:hypothetical protein
MMFSTREGKPVVLGNLNQVCLWLCVAIPLFFASGCISNKDRIVIIRGEGIVATGYAVIASQNGETSAHRRLMAIKASKLDAYRSLTEQVYGQYIDATGTMNNMSLTNEQLRSRVEGVIYGAKVVSITPIGEDTYETKLSLGQETVNDLVRNFMQKPAANKTFASSGR